MDINVIDNKRRADICFIIDSSSAMIQHVRSNWNIVKTFVKEVISGIHISSGGFRIAIVLFSTKAYVKLKLNEEYSVQRILRRIDSLPFLNGNSRNISGGLYLMNHIVFQHENGDRSDVDNIAILITSGTSTANRDTLLYAKEAKDKGVKIVAIGTTTFDTGELARVVSPPSHQTLFFVRTVTKLVSIKRRTVTEIYRPPGIFIQTFTHIPGFTMEVPWTTKSESIICISHQNTTLRCHVFFSSILRILQIYDFIRIN